MKKGSRVLKGSKNSPDPIFGWPIECRLGLPETKYGDSRSTSSRPKTKNIISGYIGRPTLL